MALYSAFQIRKGSNSILPKIIESLIHLFEIVEFTFLRVGFGFAVGVIAAQQRSKVGGLGLIQLGFGFLYPVQQDSDFSPNVPDNRIGGFYPAVELALFGADSFLLHRPDSGSLMDGGQEVKPLPFIAAVVDTDIKPFLGKLGVAHISPCLSPLFQRFRVSPIGGGNSVKEELSVPVSDTVPVLVQTINTVLFEAPCPVRVHGTDGTEEMEVGVGCAAFLGLFLVKCHINGHTPAHKVVQ